MKREATGDAHSGSSPPSPTRNAKDGDDEIIQLDIGGERFKTFRSTLTASHKDSLLARMFSDDNRALQKARPDGSYFFDRSPRVFAWLLEYYRNPNMDIHPHRPPAGIPAELWCAELNYWGLCDPKLNHLSIEDAGKIARERFVQLVVADMKQFVLASETSAEDLGLSLYHLDKKVKNDTSNTADYSIICHICADWANRAYTTPPVPVAPLTMHPNDAALYCNPRTWEEAFLWSVVQESAFSNQRMVFEQEHLYDLETNPDPLGYQALWKKYGVKLSLCSMQQFMPVPQDIKIERFPWKLWIQRDPTRFANLKVVIEKDSDDLYDVSCQIVDICATLTL